MLVVLIGLGQISMGYDLNSKDSDLILTHAKAYSLHPDFILAGGVDPKFELCERFKQNYGANAGTDLNSIRILAGHESVQTTQRYIDTNPDMLADIMKNMDFTLFTFNGMKAQPENLFALMMVKPTRLGVKLIFRQMVNMLSPLCKTLKQHIVPMDFKFLKIKVEY